MDEHQAIKVAMAMEIKGYRTKLHFWHPRTWTIDATNSASGISISIESAEQWREHQRAQAQQEATR